jgi:pimeloyl-ACP methyl ester carboxylesterase
MTVSFRGRLHRVPTAIFFAIVAATSWLVAVLPSPASQATSPAPSTALGTTALGTTTPPVANATPPSKLIWRRCVDSQLDCTTISVPMSYAQPDGRMISMAVNRLKAANPSRRLGVIFINPGGPGGSGTDFAARAESLFSATIRSRFDIIGFDPRGVGRSESIKCVTPKELDRFFAADPSPDTPAEVNEVFDTAAMIAKSCASKIGLDFLKQVGTHNVARDMDRLREALGEETISMLGFSYGTLLGATYADMFPTRVRSFVLDGALDAAASFDERAVQQAKGFERALELFAADCANRSSCSSRLGKNPMLVIDQLLARVEKKPFAVGNRKLGPGEAYLGLIRPLYSQRNGWPRLEEALVQVKAGSGAGMLDLSDAYTDRKSDGTYGSLQESNIAINCADALTAPGREHYERLAKQLMLVSPHFGAAMAYGNAVCAVWPFKGEFEGWKTTAVGAPPILVVGTRNDPATPYVWAQSMAKGFQQGGLLTWEGSSHTAYFSGSQCVRIAVDDYFVKQVLPPAGTICP